MRVLVACEFSGVVRDAFRARGHDAVSCDLLPSERQGPHIVGDVRDLFADDWDLLIAHPPCTFLANSGANYLYLGCRRENGAAGDRWVSEFTARCYHQTCDEWSADWDLRGAAQDVALAYRIGLELANSRAWPQWRRDSEFRAVREQSARRRR